MASVQKFADYEVAAQLNHNERMKSGLGVKAQCSAAGQANAVVF